MGKGLICLVLVHNCPSLGQAGAILGHVTTPWQWGTTTLSTQAKCVWAGGTGLGEVCH